MANLYQSLSHWKWEFQIPCRVHPEATAEGSVWESPPAAGGDFPCPGPAKRLPDDRRTSEACSPVTARKLCYRSWRRRYITCGWRQLVQNLSMCVTESKVRPEDCQTCYKLTCMATSVARAAVWTTPIGNVGWRRETY
jgi:hypothetical protein